MPYSPCCNYNCSAGLALQQTCLQSHCLANECSNIYEAEEVTTACTKQHIGPELAAKTQQLPCMIVLQCMTQCCHLEHESIHIQQLGV